MPKLILEGIDKIFGPKPKSVTPLIKKGKTKVEILEETGHTVGVYNANLEVEEGEFFVIMGLSGSGKSTLIRCLNRLIEPTNGKIILDGEDILKVNEKRLLEIRRTKMAMVFQKFGLLPHKTILENVMFGLEIRGIDVEKGKAKAMETIEMVGLKGYENQLPSELSGGMQQRVGLSRALANNPDIILMDEAFSALDPLIRKQMQDEILDLQNKMNKTIIFITHDLDEALKLGDRIAIMKDGAIVQIGTPEEILMNPANLYVKNFVQDVNRSKIITAKTVMKNPDAALLPKDGVRMAIHRMKENDISNIFVLDKERRLMGIIHLEDAVSVLKSKGNEASIKEIIRIEDIHKTSPDAAIEELFYIAAETKYPIIVEDENKKVLGIITRSMLLRNMIDQEVL